MKEDTRARETGRQSVRWGDSWISRRLTRNGALRKEQGKGKECHDKTEPKPVGRKNYAAPCTYTTSNSLPPPTSSLLLPNDGSPRFENIPALLSDCHCPASDKEGILPSNASAPRIRPRTQSTSWTGASGSRCLQPLLLRWVLAWARARRG